MMVPDFVSTHPSASRAGNLAERVRLAIEISRWSGNPADAATHGAGMTAGTRNQSGFPAFPLD
ncbi:hypothetical protein [Paracoccus siganidrum]|uniref:hypothetical protein n=1 Tax=Paracoccus siganidrum TaxID=1276757 RepID=UPI000F015476|nr:hypothetical protein [Paracoccus siganidrum]